jgi:hypothetical protein
MTRAVALVVYALILCAAASVALLRQPDSTTYYTVRAAMAPNHLVQADDIETGHAKSKSTPAPIVGRYARRLIGADEKVSEESFAAMPSLRDLKSALLVSVSRPAILAGVDAGRTVRLCSAGKPLGTSRAQAVLCETGDAATCLLVVDVNQQLLQAKGIAARIASLQAVAENLACP